MLKKFLLGLMIVFAVGICGVAKAENWGVGSKFIASSFTEQDTWGISGFFIVEPRGILTGSQPTFYHTTVNHSYYGSESIVVYNGSSGTVDFKIYKWIPADHGYVDNLHGTTNRSSWHTPATKRISTGNGQIDSGFAKYIQNMNFGDGTGAHPAFRFDNISTYTVGTGEWREVTRLYNNVTKAWEKVMDVSWFGTKAENYVSSEWWSCKCKGAWAGAAEPNTSEAYPYWDGRIIGCYGFMVIKNGAWYSMQNYGELKTVGETTGLEVINTNPNSFFWLATVP